MSFQKSISPTSITTLLTISLLLVSHSPASLFAYQASTPTEPTHQTKVKQLLSQNPKQSQTSQAKVAPTPSWKPGSIILYTIVSAQGGHSSPVRCIAFNPNGQFLASGSSDKTIKIWNFKAQTLERTIANLDQVIAIAFSPNPLLSLSEYYE